MCAVSGSVLSASTGEPLNDSIITMSQVGARQERRSAVTNAAGKFEFKGVEPGRYVLSAEHTAYVRMEYGQRAPGGPGKLLALLPGQIADRISFQLIPEGVITGHVYDQEGNPLEHAQVLALRNRYFDGSRRLLPAGSAITDDRGEYRLYDLPPGRYYVSASGGPMGLGTDFAYGPSYYLGAPDASQASPIALGAGNEFPGVDLALQRVGVFHVRGQLIAGENGFPLMSVSVRLVSRADPFAGFRMGARVKDMQGDFDIPGVRPGLYFLVAEVSAMGKAFQARQPVTVVDSDVDSVRLELGSGATLRGVIRVEGPADLSGIRIFLRPRDGVFFRSYTSSVSSADDTFQFSGLPDGSYSLQVFGLPQGDYVRSATLGGEDVLDSGFEISNGETSGSLLDLAISTDGGSIAGTVMLNEKPLSDALVTLLPSDSSKLANDWWFKSATTDQNGNFTLQGIRPGTYRIFAWEEIVPGEERDEAFLDNFKDSGQGVQVTPEAMIKLQVQAIATSQIQAAEAQ